MANQADTTTHARWNSAAEVLNSLTQQLAQCQPREQDRLERAVAAQEEELLDLEAPHLSGVLQKLHLLFAQDLDKPDQDGTIKRMIVEDLAALIGTPLQA